MPRHRELPFPLNLFQSRRNERRSHVRRSRHSRNTEHRSRTEYSIESRGPNGTRRIWPPPISRDSSSRNAHPRAQSSDGSPEPEDDHRPWEELVIEEEEYYYGGVDGLPPDVQGHPRNNPPSDAPPAATYRGPTSRHGEVRPDQRFTEHDGASYSDQSGMTYLNDLSIREDIHPDRGSVHCSSSSRIEQLGIRNPSASPTRKDIHPGEQPVYCGNSSRVEKLGVRPQSPTSAPLDDAIRPLPGTSGNAQYATADASTDPMPRFRGTSSRAVQTEATPQSLARIQRYDAADPPLVDRSTMSGRIQSGPIHDHHSIPVHLRQNHTPVERGTVRGNVHSRPVDPSAAFPELQGINPWATATPGHHKYGFPGVGQPRLSATFAGLDSNSSTPYVGSTSPDSRADTIRGEARAVDRHITPEERGSIRQRRTDRERQRDANQGFQQRADAEFQNREEWGRQQVRSMPSVEPSGHEDLHAIWGHVAPSDQDTASVQQEPAGREHTSWPCPVSEPVDFGLSNLAINEPKSQFATSHDDRRGDVYSGEYSSWVRFRSTTRDNSDGRLTSTNQHRHSERYSPDERAASSRRDHSTTEEYSSQRQSRRYPLERHPRYFGATPSSPTESTSSIEQHPQSYSSERHYSAEEASQYRPPGSYPLSERYASEDHTQRCEELYRPTQRSRRTERDYATNTPARPIR
jgi:hypothetical protein